MDLQFVSMLGGCRVLVVVAIRDRVVRQHGQMDCFRFLQVQPQNRNPGRPASLTSHHRDCQFSPTGVRVRTIRTLFKQVKLIATAEELRTRIYFSATAILKREMHPRSRCATRAITIISIKLRSRPRAMGRLDVQSVTPRPRGAGRRGNRGGNDPGSLVPGH